MKSKHLETFLNAFEKVKNKGWIETEIYNLNKNHSGTIGYILETEMKVEENNFDLPDFGDIEIKTHRAKTSSLITLFSKSPDYPESANKIIREKYGYLVDEFNDNRFSMTLSNLFTNSNKYSYEMKVSADDNKKKIYIIVRDKNTKKIVNNNIYYSYENIEKQLNKKLHKVAYVTPEIRKNEVTNKIEIKFQKLEFLYNLNVKNFIYLIKKGEIYIDIRLGIYSSGKNRGKRHDHGTAFRISRNNLDNLYSSRREV